LFHPASLAVFPLFGKVHEGAIFQWGCRPWPPLVEAGTEARPTDLVLMLREPSSDCKTGCLGHPERSEGSQPLENARFFASPRMTRWEKLYFSIGLSITPKIKLEKALSMGSIKNIGLAVPRKKSETSSRVFIMI
jgi:hypothetical protein